MKTILAFLLLPTVAFAADTRPKIDPEKLAAVTLTVGDWQAIVASVSDSGRVSARDANRINQIIAVQVNQQLVGSPPAKK